MRSFFKILVLVSITFFFSACGSGDPEAQAVDAFFNAVKSGDQAGINRVALTTFEEEVASWEIVERGAESEAPFQLADLEAELAEKRKELDAQKQANASFIGDNRDTYDAYTKRYAEDPSAPFTGALAAFHEELQERQGRVAQLQADADQLAFDIDALENAATLSLSTPVDASFEGQIKVKPLQVRVNDGSTDKTYTVVLHRYELVDTEQNRTPNARWIIGEIQPNS